MTCIDIGGKMENYEQWDKVVLVGSGLYSTHDKIIVCNRPLYNTCERVNLVDGRISLKIHDDNNQRAITIKQLAWDYLDNGEKVQFINCDINGDEIYVLEDLLHFAYVRQSVLHVKIYGNIPYVGDLLNLFNNVSEDISILMLHPKRPGYIPCKPNPTVAIISYNWYTFTKQMVDQLKKYTKDIVILDNGSTFPPLLNYLNEYDYTIFKFDQNYGHQCWFKVGKLREIFGDVFIITDPDLLLNPDTPRDFLNTMYDIYFKSYGKVDRVGLALDISSDDIVDTTNGMFGQRIVQWESRFWKERIFIENMSDLILYKAELDTTFCIVNVNKRGGDAIRIAGNFTAKHIPWHSGWKEQLIEGEYDWYKKGNTSSTWV